MEVYTKTLANNTHAHVKAVREKRILIYYSKYNIIIYPQNLGKKSLKQEQIEKKRNKTRFMTRSTNCNIELLRNNRVGGNS